MVPCKVEIETSYEEFCKMLDTALEKEGAGGPKIKGDHEQKNLHLEFIARAVKKKKDGERRQKRKEEDFEDLIYDKDFSISKVTWEDAQSRLSKHGAYKDLTEERAKQVMC